MNKFKKAHEMAKTIKRIYKDVDYNFQFVLCIKFLSGKELPKAKEEPVQKQHEKTQSQIAAEIVKMVKSLKIENVSLQASPWNSGLRERVYVKYHYSAEGERKTGDAGYIDLKDLFLLNPKTTPEDKEKYKQVQSEIRKELKKYKDPEGLDETV